MGSACCVAARDKNIVGAPGNDVLHRNIRYSPTWSFRWDHRGRVAGEDTSVTWFSDGIRQSDGLDNKFGSAFASEEGSPLDSFQRCAWQKSPVSEGTNTATVRTPTSGRLVMKLLA